MLVVRVVRMVGVVRIVGVVRMVTLLEEHYFVQISVGRWSVLLDVLWVLRVSWVFGLTKKNNNNYESLVNRLTYGCKPVKKGSIQNPVKKCLYLSVIALHDLNYWNQYFTTTVLENDKTKKCIGRCVLDFIVHFGSVTRY